ncbi:glycosyltransferase family 2 protein [Cellulomonas sp. PSBB021]|uniref:glycosyltransferase family 2 protein n=1 Tax=Cellulomonas sp. PSBB021 TaxID=2003551 RepID=UPI0018DF6BA6|nr:glycosyltransferase family 2 protein [Cellulomonas sp. PSBB021]
MTDGERTPAISVVVPTHDVVEWVDDCLTSMLDDQDVDLEVVVVDDGSRDGTWERVTARAAADPRVRAFRAPGVGGGQARNFGVEQARGEFLAFADGDDLVPRGAYAAMLASARSSGSDMVVGDFLKFSALQTWSPTARWTGFAERAQGLTLTDRPQLVRNRACWNRLFRTRFWREQAIAYPSVPRSNDIVPMVTALVAARTIDVVPDLVYLYRERPGGTSMTAQASADAAVASYLTQELLCAHLLGSYDDDQLAATYWQMVLNADGWVHLRRYARGAQTRGEQSAVPQLLTELLSLRRTYTFSRLRPEKQAVYALGTLGEVELAREVLDVIGDGGTDPVPMDPVRAMRATLAAAGTGLLDERAQRGLAYALVVENVAGRAVPVDEGTAAELVALAAPHTAWFTSSVAPVERPQDRLARAALVAGDPHALREASRGGEPQVVQSLVVGRTAAQVELGLPADLAAGATLELRAYKPGRPETQRPVGRVRRDGERWVARVGASALPSEGTWALELLVTAPDGELQVPLVVQRSAVRLEGGRLGRLTVRGKGAGLVTVTLFRRPSVVRRAVRALRRRGAAVVAELPSSLNCPRR